MVKARFLRYPFCMNKKILSCVLQALLAFMSTTVFAADIRPSSSDKVLILKIKGAETVPVMKSFPKVKGVEEKLYSGDELVVGDEIRVPANVVVQLRQWDGSNYFLSPGSQFKIDARLPDKQNFASWTFSLARGAVRGQVESDPGKETMKVRIKTPIAAMGVRGTDFLVTYAPDNPMRVYMRKGEVALGRSEKFEPGTFIPVKEKMVAEAMPDVKQRIAPAQEVANAFNEAMKNSGIPEAMDDIPEGKLPQSITQCLHKSMGWREVQGMGPLGECFSTQ